MDPILINKTFTAKATASKDPEKRGQFVAIVSAFGNKDSQGDIVEDGAFTKTLAEWIVKGRQIPVVWAHQFGDLFKILGGYEEAEQTPEGLKLTGQLELSWPEAQRVYELMEKELIVEFSISGQVRDYELIEDDDEDSWWPSMRIKDIDLWEAGPCFKGANANTQLLSVKSDGHLDGRAVAALRKEGRPLAAKHLDKLKSARDELSGLIDELDKTAEPADSAKNQDPNVTLFGKGADVAPPNNPHLSPAVRAALALSQ